MIFLYNPNSILSDIALVYMNVNETETKTYYNATIVLNGFPIRVNVDKTFYNFYLDDLKKNNVVQIKHCPIRLTNYKGAWNVILFPDTK